MRYWVEGADRFGAASDFPPQEGSALRLHLGSAGPDDAVHVLRGEPSAAASNTWVGVPIGLPVIGGLDDVAATSLGFELAVERETLLAGPVTANLRFSCNEIDSYVIARLSRIDADGRRHHLSMGAIRPAAHTEDTARSTANEIAIDSGRLTPLTPGEPITLRFSLTPAPTRLIPGDRLRLDVASRSDLLRLSPSEGYGHYDLPVPPYLCRNTLHFGGESWIELVEVPALVPLEGIEPPTPSLGRRRSIH